MEINKKLKKKANKIIYKKTHYQINKLKSRYLKLISHTFPLAMYYFLCLYKEVNTQQN